MIKLLSNDSANGQTSFPLKTTLIFVVCGVLWIVISDAALILYQQATIEQFTLLRIELLKGVGSVVTLGVILYLILQKQYKKTQKDTETHDLFKNSQVPMFIYDPVKAVVVEINEAGLNTYGYTREELSALSFTDIFSLDEAVDEKPPIPDNDQPITFLDGIMISKNGSFIKAKLCCLPFQFRNHDAVLMIVSHEPINTSSHFFDDQFIQQINNRIAELTLTIKELEIRNREINATNDELIELNNLLLNANKRMTMESETKFQEQTSYLKRFINQANDAMWSFDLTGHGENFINTSAVQLFGLSPEKIIDCPNFWQKFIAPREKDSILETLKQLEHQDSVEVAYTITNGAGLKKIAQRINVIRNKTTPARMEFVAREITN